ncbi:murein transglycosylase [Vibrio olivae]|uniref:Murein transglycosylase n=1 Tax=Vibrio olivae TaxID=1243002 RepID=A0ABV5HP03_9VIBR
MYRRNPSRPQRLLVGLCTLICGATIPLTSHALTLKQQRDRYDAAQTMLDKRQVERYQAMRSEIADYPLTPYIDYRAFLVDIEKRSPNEVKRFVAEHQDFPFANRVGPRYLLSLAMNDKWSTFLEYQTHEPKGETYQCHYYYANYKVGDRDLAFQGAEKLWLSGHSVSNACDDLFSAWKSAGLQTDELILARMVKAFEERNASMMRYLKKQVTGSKTSQQAQAMIALFNDPASVASFAKKSPKSAFYRQQTYLAMRALTRRDADQARQAFDGVVKAQDFSAEQQQKIADYIAYYSMNTDSKALAQWRDEAIKTTQDTNLIARRTRLAIQNANWREVKKWIDHLPEAEQISLRWQYWYGRADIALGYPTKGQQRLEKIVGQRNFYSVAAASAIHQSIHYPTQTLTLNEQLIKPYQSTLVRIDELIARDKIAAAKSEWQWLLLNVDTADKKEMLAAYAATQHWHNLTVTASIQAKMWDHLELRFPAAHQWWFNFYGEKTGIDPVTLMSLARQESAFDAKARSPVGARGLMQIMPATAKYTARKYKLSYNGGEQLFDVGKNIEIGSRYLEGLLKQYDNNRIFAFAAYNAGPNRVKTWRERTQGKLDAYAFIEAIPFNETRGYVQNILMFETYYRDLLGVDGAFLNQHEINTKY